MQPNNMTVIRHPSRLVAILALVAFTIGSQCSHAFARHLKAATALDSLTQRVNESSLNSYPNFAKELESHLAEYPNSAQLDLAIGKSFLFATRIYQTRERVAACADTLSWDPDDSALYWIERARSIDETLTGHGDRRSLKAWLEMAYLSKVLDATRAGDADGVRRALKRAASDDLLSATALSLARYVLDSLPPNSIYFVSLPTSTTSDLILATLYQQVIKEQRQDVSTICVDLLPDNVYFTRCSTGLTGVLAATPMETSALFAKVPKPLLDDDAPPPPDTIRLSSHAKSLLADGIPNPPSFVLDARADVSYGYYSRARSIIKSSRWERPVAVQIGDRSLDGPFHVIGAGLFARVYPNLPRDSSRGGSNPYFPAENRIRALQTLSDHRFIGIYTENVDTSLLWLPFKLVEQMISKKSGMPDTAEVVEVLKKVWAIPILRTGSGRDMVSMLFLLSYPAYKPEGSEQFLNDRFDQAKLELLHSEDESSGGPNGRMFVPIAKILGRCDEIEPVLQQLTRSPVLDSEGLQLAKETVREVHMMMEYLGCKEMRTNIQTSIRAPLGYPLDSLLAREVRDELTHGHRDRPRFFRPQDSIVLICEIVGSKPGKTITTKLYYHTTSTLISVDSQKYLKQTPIPDEVRRVIPSGWQIYVLQFPLKTSTPWALGEYKVDVLLDGEVRSTSEFLVAEPKLESELH